MNGPVVAKIDVRLAHDQRADAAAAAVLRRLLAVLVDNVEGTIAARDDEYLHQLRIAVRRSRTVQRQLAGVFPTLELPGFRSEFRWLQQATGEARDLDVYLRDLDELRDLLPRAFRADLEPLRPVLERRRLRAREQMTLALRSRRAAELLADWDALLESLVERSLEDRPSGGLPVGAVVGERIQKVYRAIVRGGYAVDASSPPEAYHTLRKQGKELRYLLELFGVTLYDDGVVTPLVRSLKAVQDVLGRHQDREIQVMMLRAVAEDVAPEPGGGAACVAMGVLVERLELDKARARAEFGERLGGLAERHQRRLVGETFV
jgi:CHAD domain-containing protein